MTNYGEIATAWFDVPMTLTKEQSQLIYDKVKELQPNCLINSRLGNGMYDYVTFGDNEVPEVLEVAEDEVDYNEVEGSKPSPYGLYETAATMNTMAKIALPNNLHRWIVKKPHSAPAVVPEIPPLYKSKKDCTS